MSITSKEKKGSSLKAIARNALRLKLDEQDLSDFRPKDDRFYDAYASLTLWAAVRIAGYDAVRLYLENGYNSSTVIYEGKTKYNTLKELAECARDRYDGKTFNKNIAKVVTYLEQKITISKEARPIFNVIPEEMNVKEQIDAQYITGDYVCKLIQRGRSLKILELFEAGYDYGT
ncbi:MAG: hypothetical protein KGH71_01560 [Candidatus Micrarchaeota archaeon]|nr:hypothetical protein [Candidatus Micrarchaeota archaeon]